MIVLGYYRQAYPGSNRAPFVDVDVRSVTGQWTPIRFLIDLGADATYLPASYIQTLQVDPSNTPVRNDVSGVGSSNLRNLRLLTQVRFVGSGYEKVCTVEIGLFSDPTVLDFPLIGRDLLNLFALVCDEDQDVVYLLDSQDRQRALRLLLQQSSVS